VAYCGNTLNVCYSIYGLDEVKLHPAVLYCWKWPHGHELSENGQITITEAH